MLMVNFQMLVFKFLDPDLDSISLGPKDYFPFPYEFGCSMITLKSWMMSTLD